MEHPRISIDPGVMLGKPVITGTRIPVAMLLRWLAKGMSTDELVSEYPRLTREDILVAQAFAADVIDGDPLLIVAE